jgi:hypothetical protein
VLLLSRTRPVDVPVLSLGECGVTLCVDLLPLVFALVTRVVAATGLSELMERAVSVCLFAASFVVAPGAGCFFLEFATTN